MRTSSDSTLDSAHENASLLRLLPDSLAFRGLAEPTLDAIVGPNTGDVNIIILRVTDKNGFEITDLEDLISDDEYIAACLKFVVENIKTEVGSTKFSNSAIGNAERFLGGHLVLLVFLILSENWSAKMADINLQTI